MRARRGFWISVVLIATSVLGFAFGPPVDPVMANHDSQFFRSNAQGGFQPVGIGFGFRVNELGLLNEARMFITRPQTGNPRQVMQRDADATAFSLRATLPDRPTNNLPYSDAIAVVPAILGQGISSGGFSSNDVLVSQGLSVYRTTANGPASVPAPTINTALVTIPYVASGDPATTSQCTSSNSTLTYDRWGATKGTGFRGSLILTCTGTNFLEVWLIQVVNNVGQASKLRFNNGSYSLPGTYSGRPDMTSPNFSGCGGCLALVEDTTLNVTLVRGDGATSVATVTGIAASAGRRHVRTVPPRVYEFQPTGATRGCLFGTVPSSNEIRQFPCTTWPNVFDKTANGDLLIFTAGGLVIRVSASEDHPAEQVHSGIPNFEDLAFPSLRVTGVLIQQPAASNPNKGVQGNFVFYILGGLGFDPQTQVDIQTLRFGATGNEDSVSGCATTGNDVNKDGYPDLKCQAPVSLTMCDGVNVLCIVTGFTKNPGAFDGW
jgi:hypothetical protein